MSGQDLTYREACIIHAVLAAGTSPVSSNALSIIYGVGARAAIPRAADAVERVSQGRAEMYHIKGRGYIILGPIEDLDGLFDMATRLLALEVSQEKSLQRLAVEADRLVARLLDGREAA